MTDTSTNSLATSWTLDSYTDYRYIDANLSGARLTQGIVWNADAGEWITSWQYGMARMTEDFQFIQTTGSIDLTNLSITTGIPQVLADMGFDHIGDIDYYDGKIYISLDSEASDYQNGHVAVLNASDLSYTGELYELVGDPTNPHDDVASWVAVDGANGLGYGKEWQNGTTINIYNLDDWSFRGTLEMDQSLKNIQGAKVFDGKLYFSAHDSTKSVYSVDLDSGHVEKLFDLPREDSAFNETEGIALRALPDGGVEIMVELIIDPNGDNYADAYTRLYRYVINEETAGADPTTPHTWTVNSNADAISSNDMSLTLREALSKAAAGDTITFDASMAGQTITLADTALALSKNITIKGDLDNDGKADIIIDGSGVSSAFHVTAGTVTLDGIIVTHGSHDDNGMLVDTGATLIFTNGATTNLNTEGNDTLIGTSDWDVIRGAGGNDTINGLAGNDRLYGDAGDDTLNGGDGADSMAGGNGNDIYVIDNAGDTVTELSDGGTDTVQTIFSTTLADTLENLTLLGTANISGTGNASANVLIGNTGNNTLDGAAGADAMKGGAGNDTYIVDNAGDTVVEYSGYGTDTVKAAVSFALSNNVENLVLTGADAINATGNALNNTLTGNAAANSLDGGAGIDTLKGGAGDDIYIIDNSADLVTEYTKGGNDTVKSSVGVTLSANVENLILTGTKHSFGTGNSFANVMTGNSGHNTLEGMAGDDTISGGSGHDVLIGGTGMDALYGGSGGDTFVFAKGDTGADMATADTIYDFSGSAGDRIDLSIIDANAAKSGNQGFTFLGTAAFTKHAGELRVEKLASDTYISGDTNGDGKADFMIHLDDAVTLKADHFLL